MQVAIPKVREMQVYRQLCRDDHCTVIGQFGREKHQISGPTEADHVVAGTPSKREGILPSTSLLGSLCDGVPDIVHVGAENQDHCHWPSSVCRGAFCCTPATRAAVVLYLVANTNIAADVA